MSGFEDATNNIEFEGLKKFALDQSSLFGPSVRQRHSFYLSVQTKNLEIYQYNWAGSNHDSHIFNTSNLCHYLETNNRRLAEGLILGDSGYACRPFLMTPYLNPRDRHQQIFNRTHSSTRSIIERAFGILKRRFHVLHSEVKMKPEKVCRVFGACAVLHTITLTRNEPLEDVCGVHVQQEQPVQVPNFEGEQDGRHISISQVFSSTEIHV